MRILLFGGSFNPPHLGHTAAISWALQTGRWDQIWVVPVFVHPYPEKANLIPYLHRVNMCLQTFQCPMVQVTEMERRVHEELGGDGAVRTAELLRYLKARYQDTFGLLMGSDAYDDLQRGRWLEADYVKQHEIVEIARDVASSTDVRMRLERGMKARYLDPKVLDYIQHHNLYPRRKST
jgi:nicotinate-nucleotide adenylyltransferase